MNHKKKHFQICVLKDILAKHLSGRWPEQLRDGDHKSSKKQRAHHTRQHDQFAQILYAILLQARQQSHSQVRQ